MKFCEHGQVDIEVEDNVIRVTAIGAFNEEGTQKYCASIRNAVEQLNGQPYAILSDLCRLEGATPKSWKIAEENNQWLKQTTLIAKAIVTEEKLIAAYASRVNQCYSGKEIKLFHCSAAATLWLKTLLAGT